MAGRIQIRRGDFADLPDLAEGELGYVEDRSAVYIGTSTDYNILLNPVAVNLDGYSLDGYLYPTHDNVHGLGTPDKRWKNISVGPGSLHISSKATDSGYSSNNDYKFTIDQATGNLQLIGNNNILLTANPVSGISLSGLTSSHLNVGNGSKISELNDGTFLFQNASGTSGFTLYTPGDGTVILGNMTGGLSGTQFEAAVISSWAGDLAAVYAGVGSIYGSGVGISWRNTSAWSTGSADIGISRVSPGVLGIGNGTIGDTSGIIKANSMSFLASAPSTSSDSGIQGEIRFDGSYIYRYDSGSWERASITFTSF